MEDKQPTNQEILEAISAFSTEVDKQFLQIKGEFGSVKDSMVTKDYLDTKLLDLRGDIISVIKTEDVKVAKLIEILQKRNVISPEDVKAILSMAPFPQLFV